MSDYSGFQHTVSDMVAIKLQFKYTQYQCQFTLQKAYKCISHDLWHGVHVLISHDLLLHSKAGTSYLSIANRGGRTEIWLGRRGLAWEATKQPIIHVKRLRAKVKNRGG